MQDPQAPRQEGITIKTIYAICAMWKVTSLECLICMKLKYKYQSILLKQDASFQQDTAFLGDILNSNKTKCA